MKLRGRFRAGLILIAALGAGCDAKTSPFFRPPDASQGLVPAAIGGRVTLDGVGLPGVRLTLDPTSRFIDTDSSGNYTFIPVAPGPYSVTLSNLPDDVFCPVTDTPVLVDNGDLLRVDFACVTAGGFGGTLDQDGSPLDSVPITIVGPVGGGSPADTVVVVSDSLGVFTVRNLPPGTYVLTPGPLPPGLVCIPPSQTVTVAAGEVLTVNFSCTRLGDVTGIITLDGSPLAGVGVALSGSGIGATVTDSLGRFVFTGVAAGNAFIDLAGLPAGVTCQPPRGQVSIAAAQVSTIDFVCTTGTPEPPTPPGSDVYDVVYTQVVNTCAAPALPAESLTVVASPPNGLELVVGRLPTPVSGTYDPATGDFTGRTPWLPYFGGFPFQTEFQEHWIVTFSISAGIRGDFSGQVFRNIRQTSTQITVCEISYSVTGTQR